MNGDGLTEFHYFSSLSKNQEEQFNVNLAKFILNLF